MANVAFGKVCPNDGTLVTCAGDDAQAQLYGVCPVCKAELTYVLDPIAVAKAAAEALAAEEQANIAANAAAANAAQLTSAQSIAPASGA